MLHSLQWHPPTELIATKSEDAGQTPTSMEITENVFANMHVIQYKLIEREGEIDCFKENTIRLPSLKDYNK